NSDDESLAYDNYDESLDPNRNEEVRIWANAVSQANATNTLHIEDVPPGNWQDNPIEKVTIVPQMSSTDIFQRNNESLNPFEDPNWTSGSANTGQMPLTSVNPNVFTPIETPVVSRTNSTNNPATGAPNHVIDVQATANGVISLQRAAQATSAQLIHPSSNSSPVRTVNTVQTTLAQSVPSISNPSPAQQVTSNVVSLSNSNSAISSQLVPPINNSSQTTATTRQSVLRPYQTVLQRHARLSQMANTNNVASNVGTNFTYPPPVTFDSTFVVNQPPQSAISSTRIAPSSYVLGSSSQPVTANNPQSIFGNGRSSAYYYPTASQHQIQQPTVTLLASVANQQSSSTVQPNYQFGPYMGSSAPIIPGQHSYLNSTGPTNVSHGVNNDVANTLPDDQASDAMILLKEISKIPQKETELLFEPAYPWEFFFFEYEQ
ncbi:hypothetical protein Bhyg_12136, partial [Pseudolycoriella hygida]